MRYAIAAALFASAFAVKQAADQQSASDNYFEVDEPVDSDYSIEGIVNQAEGWFATVAQPWLEANRSGIRETAIAELEAEYGPLLETCAEGTECREKNDKLIEEAIRSEWQKVMLSFRSDVDATVLKTRKIIKEGYDTAVQCEVDHPCCDVSDVVYHNILKQIKHTEDLITQKQTKWDELEQRRLEIETECPNIDFETVYDQYRSD